MGTITAHRQITVPLPQVRSERQRQVWLRELLLLRAVQWLAFQDRAL